VPYLMSSHPGSTLNEAIDLALCLKRDHYAPEQVQDYYPTPGTASTVMYYTGLDPFTGKAIYTATDYREKQLQRALLQWRKPENRRMIYEAMDRCSEAGRAMLQELVGQKTAPSAKNEKAGKHKDTAGKSSGGRLSGERKTGGGSDRIPGKAGGKASGKAGDKVSGKAAGQAPGKIPGKTPGKVPGKLPGNAPDKRREPLQAAFSGKPRGKAQGKRRK